MSFFKVPDKQNPQQFERRMYTLFLLRHKKLSPEEQAKRFQQKMEFQQKQEQQIMQQKQKAQQQGQQEQQEEKLPPL